MFRLIGASTMIGIALVLSPALAVSKTDDRWAKYQNADGTQVDVPRRMFSKMAGESALGRGERLITEDGRAELAIYVLPNDETLSPAAYLKKHMSERPSELDYLRVARNFFVTSKYSGSVILYRRCNFSFGTTPRIHCIDLAYPAQEKKAWDSPVTRISRSLRPL